MAPCHADIDRFIWTKVARGCQLGIKGKSGATTNFTGFRDQVQPSQPSLVCIHREMHSLISAVLQHKALEQGPSALAALQDLEQLQQISSSHNMAIEVCVIVPASTSFAS